jgi:gluconolactonase
VTAVITHTEMEGVRTVADGLRFPEGPVVLPDGDLLVVEVRAGTVSRVRPDGSVEPVAACGGAPNGAALGPDGAVYVCNNGGAGGRGRIERVDPASGDVTVLYTECEGRPLNAANDLVFDRAGNFWFTDSGASREHDMDFGAVCYASPDGERIHRVVGGLIFANGIGLAPDEEFLYFTESARPWLYRRRIASPGTLEPSVGLHPTTLGREGRVDSESLLAALPGYQPLDSLAVDAAGYIAIGTLAAGCLSVVSPDGSSIEQLMPPPPGSKTTS